jgi:hypothetical protein
MSRPQTMSAVPLIVAYVPIVLVVLLLWTTGYLGAMIRGPKIVQSRPSPDGKHIAYVRDEPSVDPPNQSLLVERGDKTRFLAVAKLVADVDSIENIVWSPDSQIVVFLSRCYLTATRVSDWESVRIYLGREWIRSRPSRVSTFSGAQPVRKITALDFPAPDTVSYQIDGKDDWNSIRMTPVARPSKVLSDQRGQAFHDSVVSDSQAEPQR